MSKILILKTGSTLPRLAANKGDFEDWILSGMGASWEQAQVVDIASGATLPGYDQVAGVVITGSHAMVTEHSEWSERAAAWIAGAVERGVPCLGICYGHQLLAHALGGEVRDNPRGFECGSVALTLDQTAASDRLLGELHNSVRVQVCHHQSVLRLPRGAVPLASSRMDPHQAFAIGENAWGIQFHPEFDAEVMRAYIQFYRQELAGAGQDPEALLESVCDTPGGAQILKRFAAILSAA